MLVCPFCEKLVPCFKTNSHVIPEWMYREGNMYDKKGRAVYLDLKNPKKYFFQKGYRGDFLCENCEKKTAQLDEYASLIFKNRDCSGIIKKEKKIIDTSVKRELFNIVPEVIHIWSGIDFKKTQKFIYSICLRQHFYNLSKGIKELIVDKHLSHLLKLYRSEQLIDDYSYPIYIIYLDKNESHKYIIPPCVNKMSGHHVIQFVACGFQFIIKVSSHSGLFEYDNSRLRSSGSIHMLQVKFEYSRLIKETLYMANQAAYQIENPFV